MLYRNDDADAVRAMELARTGYYGGEDLEEIPTCPCCGTENPEVFYINDNDDCVGCSSCVWASEVLF